MENLPSFNQMRDFLNKRYKHGRFEARDDWYDDCVYSDVITQSHLDSLKKNGWSSISRHESVTGKALIYNQNLEFITSPQPLREEI